MFSLSGRELFELFRIIYRILVKKWFIYIVDSIDYTE